MKILRTLVPKFVVAAVALATLSFATPSAQARWWRHHPRVYVYGGYPYGYYYPGYAYYGPYGGYYGPGVGFAFGGHGYYHGGYYRGGYRGGGRSHHR